jgi:hypothetical protein
MTNQKCQRWAQDIADTLSMVLGSLYTVSIAFDSNTDVYVTVALAAGGNNSVKALISLRPAAPPASGAVDSLGLTQTVYTPHIAAILYDITTPFSAGTTEKERAIVDWKVLSLGTHVDFYSETAAGSNIAIADFPFQATPGAATLRASVDNIDLRNGTLSNL